MQFCKSIWSNNSNGGEHVISYYISINMKRLKTELDPLNQCGSRFLLWLFLKVASTAPQNLTYALREPCWRSEFTKKSHGDSNFSTKCLRKEARLDKLPDWLCAPLQGRALHPDLFVSEDLTGAMEEKRWRLVSTNEKWQMHKSFRLCHVMGSAWHGLGLFGDSTARKLPRISHAIPDVLKWAKP